MSIPWFLELLELPPHADERAVRRAYAIRLKRIDPAIDPEGFARLREAYEAARIWVADEDHDVAVQPSPTVVTEPSTATLAGEQVTPHEEAPTDETSAQPAVVAINPQEQATRLVDGFATRIAEGANEDVRQELEACTAELRLQYIDAPGIFEDVLIDRLARGLIGKRVAVFAHATDIFHWQEIGHLAALGPKGMWIEAVESQRMAWATLPPLVRENRLALIERVEATKGVLPTQIVRRWFEVRDDFRRFPAYLGLYLTPLIQQKWASHYDALPIAERQALETPARKRRLRVPTPVWAVIVILALGVLSRPELYPGTLAHRPAPAAASSVPAPSAPTGASLANDLQVALAESVDPARRGKGWIVITLTNRGRSTLYLRKALTPPMTTDGHVTRPLFNIIDQQGAWARFRGEEDPDDSRDPATFYIRLGPGQTLTNTVDLSIDYDLVPESRYTIRYAQPVAGNVSVDENGTPHDQSEYVASNTVHMTFHGRGRSGD
jgi:hypothetical protein